MAVARDRSDAPRTPAPSLLPPGREAAAREAGPSSADGATAALALQARLGNGLLGGVLGGTDLSGLEQAVTLTLGSTWAGLAQPVEDPFSSNRCMQQLLGGSGLAGIVADGAVLARHGAGQPALDEHAILGLIGRSSGAPLPPAVEQRLSAALGHDFRHVRVHLDAQAAQAAQAVHAHAFTVGRDVYFGRGEYAPGTSAGDALLAHELTHVIQHDQGRIPKPTASGITVSDPSDGLEREAERSAARAAPALAQADAAADAEAARGGLGAALDASIWAAATAHGALGHAQAASAGAGAGAGAAVMPDLWDDVKSAASEGWDSARDTVSDGVDAVTSLGADALLALVRQVAPELADFIQRGPAQVIQEVLERSVGTFLGGLFGGLDLGGSVTAIQEALGQVLGGLVGAAQGDAACCDTFTKGLGALTDLFRGFLQHPVLEQIRGALTRVNEAATRVFTLVVAPQFEMLQAVMGGAWSAVTGIADQVSGWISTVREHASAAWDWVSEKLGLGGGEGGVWSWFTGLAQQAWTSISQTFAPVIGPLQTIGTVLAALTPFGQIYLLVTAGSQVVEAGRWLYEHWGDPDLVEKAHQELGRGMLPQLIELLSSLGGAATQAAGWLVGQLTGLATAFDGLISGITGVPLLQAAGGVLQSLSQHVQGLLSWAGGALTQAAQAVQGVATSVWQWAQPIVEVCSSIALCIVNPGMIPVVIAGWAWALLPECLKGPIIDFLLDILIEALRAMPELPMFGPLWMLLKPGVLGFLETVRAQDTAVKVKMADKFAKIIRGSSLAFIWGFVKGFLRGLWEGLTDPFVLAWTLISGLGQLGAWVAGMVQGVAAGTPAPSPATAASPTTGPGTEAPTPGPTAGVDTTQSQAGVTDPQALGARASEMWAQLGPQVSTVAQEFMPAVQEFFAGGEGMDFAGLMEKLGALWPQAYEAIRGAGGALAQQLIAYFTADSAEGEMGEAIGWLAGAIVFEVVLAILTAGVANTVSAAGKALKLVLKVVDWTGEALGMAFRGLQKLGGLLLDVVRGLARAFGSAGGALGRIFSALGEIGQKLIDDAAELLGFVRRSDGAADEVAGATTRTTGREATEELGERTGRESMEEGAERTGREGAEEVGEQSTEEVVEEGAEQGGRNADTLDDATQKQQAEAQARIAIHASNMADTPLPALMGVLAGIAGRYRAVHRFESSPQADGDHAIYMIASRKKVGEHDTNDNDDETGNGTETGSRPLSGEHIDHIRQGDRGGRSGGHDFELNTKQLESNGYRNVDSPENYNRIVEQEQAYKKKLEAAMIERAKIQRINKDLKRKEGEAWKKWAQEGKVGPRPESVQLQLEPELPTRASSGLPDEPQKIYYSEPGPGGTQRGAVFPSDSHTTGKAWFPEGTTDDDLQRMADEMRKSGPGASMGEGSPARVWISTQQGPDGPYRVVMIDDGNGGVTMTPDLQGWEVP